MAIDLLNDRTLPLTGRGVVLRRDGRPAHPSTLRRWATTGVRGVRLETAMLGGVRVTTAALRRFFAELNRKTLSSAEEDARGQA